MLSKSIITVLIFMLSLTFAQQKEDIELGKLKSGAAVSFVSSSQGEWGIEVRKGTTPNLVMLMPAQVEVFCDENNIIQLKTGYKSVKRLASYMDCEAEIDYKDNVKFYIYDRWGLSGDIVSVFRKVEVVGNCEGGFSSSVIFDVDPSVNWSEVNCLAPGALYGDPSHNGDRSPGGTLNYDAKQFIFREDALPAPFFALSFKNGSSISILDPTPNGESTFEETKIRIDIMADERFQFGALGAWQNEDKPIEFGFTFPGTISLYPFGPNASKSPKMIRRYHPIKPGVVHSYNLSFRFGTDESFPEVTRNTWRWAWDNLKPEVTKIDVEQMRRILTDHMAEQATTICCCNI
jgi:hypothetical protein